MIIHSLKLDSVKQLPGIHISAHFIKKRSRRKEMRDDQHYFKISLHCYTEKRFDGVGLLTEPSRGL